MSSKKVVQSDVASAKNSLAGLEARPAKRRRKDKPKPSRLASDLYKDTLGKWMWKEKLSCGGSWDTLAERIKQAWPGQQLSGPTVNKWGDGTYTEELRRDRLALLARYRKTTPEVIQAWLESGIEPKALKEGSPPAPPCESSVQSLNLESLSISEMLDLIEVLCAKIRDRCEKEEPVSKRPYKGLSQISAFIQSLMRIRGLTRAELAKETGIGMDLLDFALDSHSPLSGEDLATLSDGLTKVSPRTLSHDLLNQMNRSSILHPELKG
jgi:hypothetical protein